jgi:putative transcriptional regulator
MTHVIIHPGLLDRLKENSGNTSDEAFAHAIGSSRSTLDRVKAGRDSPSIGFIAGIAAAFGLGLGEVAIVALDEPDESIAA